MTTELIVPALGESITEATVSKWLKEIGEPFDIDEPLVEIETDKITVEVSAPQAGSLKEIITDDLLSSNKVKCSKCGGSGNFKTPENSRRTCLVCFGKGFLYC